MNQLDVFYRAFADYRKQTGENRECSLERNAVASSTPEADVINVVITSCTVEEDWINAIDEGLVHIGKAINEGRQFIRSRGEVLPIEKVKRVSKDSVEHLEKHSELITRKSESGNIIPDKLYTVERLSDFAIYENRFLYMLLCYLRSFISLRYSKILDLTNTYRGGVTINKVVAANKRRMVFELKLTDEKQDDRYLKEHNKLQPVLGRIDNLLETVMHFLATPLMQEVSKVPMLKPPITKTNVLKMNRNFKGAVALYDFVTAYDKQGYIVEKREERINPLPQETAGEFAEIVMLTSFLAYKQGLMLNKFLKNSYREEEERRNAAELEKKKEQLMQLRRRISESGCDPSEYMLLLEKHNKTLELDSLQLASAKQEIEKLQTEAAVLKENIQSLSASVEEKQNEIHLINRRHSDETVKLKAEHEQQITAQSERYETETGELKRQHSMEIDSIISGHESKIAALNETFKVETKKKDSKILELENRFNKEQELFHAEVEKLEALNNQKNLEWQQLSREKALSDSRLNAVRKEYNLISQDEDFNSQASFDELEHQLKVFKSFFKEEWKKTKKKIRKKILKPEPGEKENSSGS